TSLSAAPGGVTAATPRLIASMAEGERASAALARLPKDSGGENSLGCGAGLEQPAKITRSKNKKAARQNADSASNGGFPRLKALSEFSNILAICLRLVKFFLGLAARPRAGCGRRRRPLFMVSVPGGSCSFSLTRAIRANEATGRRRSRPRRRWTRRRRWRCGWARRTGAIRR